MDRSISILQVLLTGEYLLHPFGRFSGYGGYVGIYPYRLLAADCTDEELGETVTKLLAQSKATGYAINEIDKYRSDQDDLESERLRQRFFAKRRSNPSTKFQHIDVSQRSRAKSVTLSLLRDLDSKGIEKPVAEVRVPLSAGAAAIGQAIREIANSDG